MSVALATERDIQPDDKVFRLIPPQAGFIQSAVRYPAYVAAWGCGKSTALIARAMIASETYPDNYGVIFRKEFVDLRDSTIKDFETYTGLKVPSNRTVVLANGSQIIFRHAEEENNIKNMNLGWFAIEQAEELMTDGIFSTLRGRLRRKHIPHHWGAIIANTNGHNWIWKSWKMRALENSELFEAASQDAAHYLPAETWEDWQKLEQSNPKIFRRFVKNSYDEADTTDYIIQPSWVDSAKGRLLVTKWPTRRIVSIDVARGGSDKSVFYAIENNRALGYETWETRNTMELVGRAQIFAEKFSVDAYAVDEIGVGAGVADRLKELHKEVIFVNAAERKDVPPNFFNRRSEILGTAARLFEEGRVSLLKDDLDLAEQLSWTKWQPVGSNKELRAESKDEVREEYGRSPDNADAFLNGLWALPKTMPVGDRTPYSPVGSVAGGQPAHGRFRQRIAKRGL